jgi:hypothetical protein
MVEIYKPPPFFQKTHTSAPPRSILALLLLLLLALCYGTVTLDLARSSLLALLVFGRTVPVGFFRSQVLGWGFRDHSGRGGQLCLSLGERFSLEW